MTPSPDLSAASGEQTLVHLLRHGEVDNPTGILYGQLPGFHLSELGRKMARRAAETLADRDIVRVVSSPLERAQETAQPCAERLGLEVVTDPRLTEAANAFQGRRFGVGDGVLRRPSSWWQLRNPARPSWGEPYRGVVARMLAALADARAAAAGHEALIVSHQLPIWILRSHLEGRRLMHDPRRRQCTLASLTTITYAGDQVVGLAYCEPAADLLPPARRPAASSTRA
jgi:broad specificity phosphatase PhoE